jgi:putative mycofactocin binding protein MftB
LSVTSAPVSGASFEVGQAWRLSRQVALRDEAFGALAYHFGTRRLVFLKSRLLVTLVASLEQYPSAADAIEALVPEHERASYRRALARLASSEVIDAR